jgi:ADP-ribose pyrophosphatase YjhB (NUDIX family)
VTTPRKFCRFNKQPETAALSITEIPPSGFCMSAFLVITEKGHRNRVLMGKLNPEANWDHIGALDMSRAVVHAKGWMLPSSHLIFKEPPQEAARRIYAEQLEIHDLELFGPTVISYVDRPKRFPRLDDHWDLEFVFKGEIVSDLVPSPFAWKEIKMVDLSFVSKSEMARSHEDILEPLGLRFGSSQLGAC